MTGCGLQPAATKTVSRLLAITYGNAKWRRRGSNPNTACPNCLAEQPLTNSEDSLSANSQQTGDSNWLDLSTIDADLREIIDRWEALSEESRRRLLNLVEDVAR